MWASAVVGGGALGGQVAVEAVVASVLLGVRVMPDELVVRAALSPKSWAVIAVALVNGTAVVLFLLLGGRWLLIRLELSQGWCVTCVSATTSSTPDSSFVANL